MRPRDEVFGRTDGLGPWVVEQRCGFRNGYEIPKVLIVVPQLVI